MVVNCDLKSLGLTLHKNIFHQGGSVALAWVTQKCWESSFWQILKIQLGKDVVDMW